MTSLACLEQHNTSALSDGSSILSWREPPGRLGDFVRRIKTYHRIPVDPVRPFAGNAYFAKPYLAKPYLVSARASDSAAAISA